MYSTAHSCDKGDDGSPEKVLSSKIEPLVGGGEGNSPARSLMRPDLVIPAEIQRDLSPHGLSTQRNRDTANLETLDLSGTRVTDAGLEQPHCMKNLRQLRLDRTGVTDEGVERLHDTLPKCTVAR